MTYKTLIFDLDGTLLDTSKGILAAVKEVFDEKNIPYLSDDEMRSFIGPPIEHTFGKLLDLDAQAIKALAIDFRNAYFSRHLLEAKVFDEIPALLRECKLRGVKTAVATNKRENQTVALLKAMGLFDLFDVVHGTDEHGILKKSDVIQTCISDLNVEKEGALMIGDAWSDEVGAQEAQVDFAAAMYGFGFTDKSEINCVFKCKSPIELLELI